MVHTCTLVVLLLVLLPVATNSSSIIASCRVTMRPCLRSILAEGNNTGNGMSADCGQRDIGDLALLDSSLASLQPDGHCVGSADESGVKPCGSAPFGLKCLLTFFSNVTVNLHIDVSSLSTSGVNGIVCVAGLARVFINNGSRFSDNTALDGSVVSIGNYGSANITNASFCNNNVMRGSISVNGSGQLMVTNSFFIDNVAKIGGGGISVGYVGQQTAPAAAHSFLNVENSEFRDNTAYENGGAISVMQTARVQLLNNTFVNNTAVDVHKGGAIYGTDNTTFTINQCSFYSNNCTNGFGGALALQASTKMNVSNSLFDGNYGSQGGAAVYLEDWAHLSMTGCNMTNNTGGAWGGAMMLQGKSSTANLTYCDCSRNMAGSSGGCLVAQDYVTVSMTACTVTGNVAHNGGGLQLQQSAKVTLDNVSIMNNSAEDSGGIQATNLNLEFYLSIKNSQIRGHRGVRVVGAMSVNGGNLTLGPNVNITNNHALAECGGLMIIGGTTIIKAGVVVANNSAGTTGGGIYWAVWDFGGSMLRNGIPPNRCSHHTDLSISKLSSITGNSAGLAGGGMFIGRNITTRKEAEEDYKDSVKNNTASYAAPDIYVVTDQCEIGQYRRGSNDWCDKCPPGQYNINTTDPVCHPCNDTTANCSLGGAAIVPKSMFWQDTTGQCNLDNITRCPNTQACKRNKTVQAELVQLNPYSSYGATANSSVWAKYQDHQCSPGYTGVLCTVCKAGYGRTDGFSCEPCLGVQDHNRINTAGIAGMITVYFVMFTLYVLLTSVLSLYNGSQSPPAELNDIEQGKPWWHCLEFNDVSKAFVTYLQYTVGIIAKVSVAWPPILDSPLTELTRVWGFALGSAVPLDCLLQLPNSRPIFRAGIVALINLVAPVLTFIAVMVCHLVLWWSLALFLHYLRKRRIPVANTARVPFSNRLLGIGVVYRFRAAHVAEPTCPGARQSHHSSVRHRCFGYLAARLWQLAEVFVIQWGWECYQKAATTFAKVAFIVSVFFWYPSIMRVFIGAVMCVKGCGEQKFWVMDTRQACPWQSGQGQNQNRRWALGIGIPAGVICLTIVALVIGLLVRAQNTGQIHQRKFKMVFGYLYSDHKYTASAADGTATDAISDLGPCEGPAEGADQLQSVGIRGGRRRSACSALWQYCGTCLDWLYGKYRFCRSYLYLCWDAVLHCQTFILVFISVYGQLLHEYYQVLILCFTFAAYLMLLMWLKPYQRGSQQLQTISFVTMLATSFATLAFIPPIGVLGFDTGQYGHMTSSVAGSVLAVNAVLVLLMLVLLLSMLLRDIGNWRSEVRAEP